MYFSQVNIILQCWQNNLPSHHSLTFSSGPQESQHQQERQSNSVSSWNFNSLKTHYNQTVNDDGKEWGSDLLIITVVSVQLLFSPRGVIESRWWPKEGFYSFILMQEFNKKSILIIHLLAVRERWRRASRLQVFRTRSLLIFVISLVLKCD